MGSGGLQSLANRATAIAADDVGGKAGFIDKQQMIDIEAVLLGAPGFTRGFDVWREVGRPVLFGCVQGFF